MKKYLLFVFFAFAFFPNLNFACTCLPPPSFCEGLFDSNGDHYSDVIFRGEIIGDSPEGKEIEISQMIYGEIDENTIIVRPTMCTAFYHELEDDGEYIFSLETNNGNYYPIGCNLFFLKIENEVVKGKIAPGVESIDYKDLNTLESCGIAFKTIPAIVNDLVLYPNPTLGAIKIKNINTDALLENLQLQVFDMLGREVAIYKNEDGILPDEIWAINIQYFAAGVYFLKLSGKNGQREFKIVKQ